MTIATNQKYYLQIQVVAKVITEITAEIAGRMELKAQVKIQQLKAQVKIRQLEELKVFNSLRLSVVVTTEILTKVLMDITAEVLVEITVEILTEVKASLVVYSLNSSIS